MEVTQSTYGNSNVNSLLGGTSTETTEDVDEDYLGRNSFLTMLVAQLQNQDPLNPMEGTDFATQLAQFSVLEQQIYTNNNLEAILDALGAQKETNLIDYIGKEVQGEANTITVADGVATSASYELASQADAVVYIYDSDGNMVNSIYEGQKSAGTHTIDWDGRDFYGDLVGSGTYTFDVTALSTSGGYIAASTSVTGEVTGVTYKNGTPFLQVGDQLLDPSTVTSVWQSEEDDTGDEDVSE